MTAVCNKRHHRDFCAGRHTSVVHTKRVILNTLFRHATNGIAMNKYSSSNAIAQLVRLTRVASFLGLVAVAAVSQAQTSSPASAAPLPERVRAFDAAFFNAFNTCDLATLERMIAPELEFFHDLGGTSRTRATFLESTKANVCGKFTRQLVKPSLESWTLGKEGAIYSGTHHFCHTGKTGCQGSGRFLHVLDDRNGQLVLLRAVSYDHQELKPAK